MFIFNKKGFTLVEILTVVAIMSILIGIMTVSFGDARAKSRDAKRISDIAQIQLILEYYYEKNNMYPLSLNDLNSEDFTKVPEAPQPGDSEYKYAVSQNKKRYHLGITLETDNEVLRRDADYTSPVLGWTGSFNGEGNVYDVVFPSRPKN
jgi:prepilin-type N-terminal cleavage/methylation domain-containing protein